MATDKYLCVRRGRCYEVTGSQVKDSGWKRNGNAVLMNPGPGGKHLNDWWD